MKKQILTILGTALVATVGVLVSSYQEKEEGLSEKENK
jgi:hypothetical protein